VASADIAVLAIFAPLLGAGLVPVAGLISAKARDAAAIAFGLATAILTVLTLFAVTPTPAVITRWIPVLNIPFSLRIDALGAYVAVIAGVIGFLVLLYSLAYMRHAAQEGYSLRRYYALVLLFIGAMIGLGLSDSLLAFYIFWETVGLCSFALISYYHRDPKARRAGLKAFAVTRVGDIGLVVAIVAVWSAAGVLTFSGLLSTALPAAILPVAAVGMLLAALGKSAQMPLHVWLPDAMEAPTTISALIHAATMVNAGVYLVARVFPAFEGLGWWPASLLWIGAITALLAAIAAYVEPDIKRVLAHSTISQLGYMVSAVGAGAILASQFHLLSQAVFKALLFLAAGAVIQAVGTRDLYRMGGLRTAMPRTSWAFLIGVLAMVGIPIFNGFWSKDLLLEGILDHGDLGPFVLLGLAALATAAYSWRAYWLVFHGERRSPAAARDAPWPMSYVILALAGGAATTWLLIGPYSAAMAATMPAYPVEALGLSEAIIAVLQIPAVVVTLVLAALSAYLVYGYARRFEAVLPGAAWPVRLIRSGYLFDAAYRRLAEGLAALAQRLRRTQTGDLNVNAAGILAALIIVLVVLLLEVL